MEKNPIVQHLIKAMEKPLHLTDEDIEALHQSIEEGKIPIKFDSPFELDECEKYSTNFGVDNEIITAYNN